MPIVYQRDAAESGTFLTALSAWLAAPLAAEAQPAILMSPSLVRVMLLIRSITSQHSS